MEMMNEASWGTVKNNPKQESVETRRERFIRIGNSRMRRLINTYRLIGGLATSSYQYYDKDIEVMQEAIKREHEACWAKFKKKPREKKPEVDFDLSAAQ